MSIQNLPYDTYGVMFLQDTGPNDPDATVGTAAIFTTSGITYYRDINGVKYPIGGIPSGLAAAGQVVWTPKVAHSTNVASRSGPQTLDGVSCVAGDQIWLIGQTDAKENGPYTVQTGAWTRPSLAVAPGQIVFPLFGNAWVGVTLEVLGQGALTYGTSNIVVGQINQSAITGQPANRNGVATLVAGVVLISNVTLYAGSSIQITRRTPAGTAIGILSAPAADRTNGVGTGAFRVRSYKTDGTAETNDISTVDWSIIN